MNREVGNLVIAKWTNEIYLFFLFIQFLVKETTQIPLRKG